MHFPNAMISRAAKQLFTPVLSPDLLFLDSISQHSRALRDPRPGGAWAAMVSGKCGPVCETEFKVPGLVVPRRRSPGLEGGREGLAAVHHPGAPRWVPTWRIREVAAGCGLAQAGRQAVGGGPESAWVGGEGRCRQRPAPSCRSRGGPRADSLPLSAQQLGACCFRAVYPSAEMLRFLKKDNVPVLHLAGEERSQGDSVASPRTQCWWVVNLGSRPGMSSPKALAYSARSRPRCLSWYWASVALSLGLIFPL